jgi:hypothetical protein
MKIAKLLTLVGVLVSAYSASAFASQCPNFPPMEFGSNGSSGGVDASMLTKLLGNIGFKGDYKRTTDDILSRYPHSNILLIQISLYVSECELIASDRTLSTREKLELFRQAARDAVNLLAYLVPDPKASSNPGNFRSLIMPAQFRRVNLDTDALARSIQQRQEWQNKWFRLGPNGTDLQAPRDYHVIVASPKGETAAQEAMKSFSQRYPNVAFQLWKKTGNDYYAVTVGIGLTQGEALSLTAEVKQMGMQAFPWHDR